MRYSDDIIEEVRMKNDIVDVISQYVRLTRRGSSYFGLCPFHNEKTPSFSVTPSKQMYYCFGCGAGGNVYNFVMQYENYSFGEALSHLAERAGVELPKIEYSKEARAKAEKRAALLEINKKAAQYFYYQLRREGGKNAHDYLTGRGLSEETIRKFGLGYSDKYSDDLYKYLKSQNYSDELLRESGLFNVDERQGMYDKFWNRVIFPIMDVNNRVIGFGGRVMGDGKPKYLNSPETRIFDKSRNLYGLNIARTTRKNYLILCEGYMDVISMHQSGIENVVASSGTALTPGQIRMIHRFTNNMTVLYDGDAAGIKASIRGIDMLLEEGMNIKVCLLPDGDDPDSFARKHNSTEFQAFISEHETDFIRFKTNLLLEDAGKDPIKRAELIGNLVQSISVIPEAIVRDVYIKECAQLLHVEDKLLVSEVAKRRETQAEKRAEQTERERRMAERTATMSQGTPSENAPMPNGDIPLPPEIDNGYTEVPPSLQEDNYASFIPQEGKEGQEFYKFERLILQAVVRYGEKIMCNLTDEEGNEIPVTVIEYVINDLKEDELAFHNPLHRQMLSEAAAHMHDSNFIAERYFLAHPDPVISKLSVDLINVRYQLSKYHSKSQKIVTDEERLYEMVPMLMINFKYAIVTEELKHMLYALQDPALAHDNEKCDSLMKRFNELKTVQSIMAKRLGDRVVLR